jgi:hypothetical protein
MKSELISQTFNGQVEWRLEGNYFKLLSAAANVRVELFKGGRLVALAPSVPSGFYQRVLNPAGDAGFDHVKITTGSSHLVEFVTAPDEGGIDRVNAQGSLGSLAQQLIGGVSALVTTDRGFAYGASFASNTALGANTNEQILAPAANLNGVIVWTASMSSSQGIAAADSIVGLMAKTAAPASMIDGDVLLTLDVRAQTAVGFVSGNVSLERAVLVAAGKGLYFRNGGGGAETTGYRSILYTAL